ncbi:MAG: response regulator transcription factor [Anaerolineales bacterium]|nr:response regulator transcription factor [Anaerolineales bacterium]
MNAEVRIVVVDDHTLFRRGLVGLLAEMEGFRVVGEAANGQDALGIIEMEKPDIVLLDVNMPGMSGIQTLAAMRKQGLASPVLMLTISQHEDDLIGAIRVGASGYLLKNAEPETLRQTIKQVVAGKSVLSPEVTEQVFRLVRSGQLDSANLLTDREVEVLRFLSRGLTTAQTGAEMFISENTVKTHVRHILYKLEVSNRAEAVAKATQIGLI